MLYCYLSFLLQVDSSLWHRNVYIILCALLCNDLLCNIRAYVNKRNQHKRAPSPQFPLKETVHAHTYTYATTINLQIFSASLGLLF